MKHRRYQIIRFSALSNTPFLILIGSSNVDAPMSRPEANRTMRTLKEGYSEETSVNTSILLSRHSDGDLELIEAATLSVLSSYPIKTVMFCCRGTEEFVKDCFAFTVRYRIESMECFQCHVIKVCSAYKEISQTCL